jgi:hypothetical protein
MSDPKRPQSEGFEENPSHPQFDGRSTEAGDPAPARRNQETDADEPETSDQREAS